MVDMTEFISSTIANKKSSPCNNAYRDVVKIIIKLILLLIRVWS